MTSLTDTQVVTASGGLVELGYLEWTGGDITLTGTTFPATQDVSGVLTFVSDGSPLLVEWYGSGTGVSGVSQVVTSLFIDGSESSRYFGQFYNPDSAAWYGPLGLQQRRMTLSAGSHTVQVKGMSSNGGGVLFNGSGSTSGGNSFLRVSKIVEATQWPAVTTGTIICTSSTRPASPFEGQKIFETDTDFTYTYSGSAWTLTGTLGSGFVTASSTTSQGPGATLTYTHATITITPGVWIVNAEMSVFNATTGDGAAVGIYNRTTSSIVSGSMGTGTNTNTAASIYGSQILSAPTKVVVTSNTDLCPYATRNGGSNLQTTNWTGLHSQGSPVGRICAQRLYGG